ncbi:MAG: hypothetical protein VYA84_12075 [Planctomycetota bacterium]|nr:hypothetical protein [Planctomycetota bacterium]
MEHTYADIVVALSSRSTFKGFQSGSLMAVELVKVSSGVMTDMHNKTQTPLFEQRVTVISRLLLTLVEAWLVPQIRTRWLGLSPWVPHSWSHSRFQ